MVIFVAGLPGTGKSFFAEALSKRLNAVHISSDKVRAVLNKRGSYDENSRLQVYHEMLSRMIALIKEEQNVIVDSTFYKEKIRNMFFDSIRKSHLPIVIIQTEADEKIIKERTNKQRKESEADYNVYLKLKSDFEPIKEPHLKLYSDLMSVDEMIAKTIKYFDL